jgi:hypothetical protein
VGHEIFILVGESDFIIDSRFPGLEGCYFLWLGLNNSMPLKDNSAHRLFNAKNAVDELRLPNTCLCERRLIIIEGAGFRDRAYTASDKNMKSERLSYALLGVQTPAAYRLYWARISSNVLMFNVRIDEREKL